MTDECNWCSSRTSLHDYCVHYLGLRAGWLAAAPEGYLTRMYKSREAAESWARDNGLPQVWEVYVGTDGQVDEDLHVRHQVDERLREGVVLLDAFKVTREMARLGVSTTITAGTVHGYCFANEDGRPALKVTVIPGVTVRRFDGEEIRSDPRAIMAPMGDATLADESIEALWRVLTTRCAVEDDHE